MLKSGHEGMNRQRRLQHRDQPAERHQRADADEAEQLPGVDHRQAIGDHHAQENAKHADQEGLGIAGDRREQQQRDDAIRGDNDRKGDRRQSQPLGGLRRLLCIGPMLRILDRFERADQQ